MVSYILCWSADSGTGTLCRLTGSSRLFTRTTHGSVRRNSYMESSWSHPPTVGIRTSFAPVDALENVSYRLPSAGTQRLTTYSMSQYRFEKSDHDGSCTNGNTVCAMAYRFLGAFHSGVADSTYSPSENFSESSTFLLRVLVVAECTSS